MAPSAYHPQSTSSGPFDGGPSRNEIREGTAARRALLAASAQNLLPTTNDIVEGCAARVSIAPPTKKLARRWTVNCDRQTAVISGKASPAAWSAFSAPLVSRVMDAPATMKS